MSSHLEGRSKFDESLDNDILQELCRFVVFENQSVPDSSVEAMKKRARGYNESSANWVTPASPSTTRLVLIHLAFWLGLPAMRQLSAFYRRRLQSLRDGSRASGASSSTSTSR
eukprot:966421-Rhodomonas_salina.2